MSALKIKLFNPYLDINLLFFILGISIDMFQLDIDYNLDSHLLNIT